MDLIFLLQHPCMLLEHGQRGHFGSSDVEVEVTVIRFFSQKVSPGHDKLFLLVILDEVFSSGIAETTQET